MTWTTRPRSEIGPLAAIVAGRGPRVVLLHGVGLRAEAWARQIDALTVGGFSVIAPDMPGHGDGPMAEGLTDLQGYAERVLGCLDEPAVVAGHSMGAMIALDLAARYPERLRGVMAVNAIFRRGAEAKQAVTTRVAALDGMQAADPTGTLARWFGDAPSVERAACELWLKDCDPAGYKAAYSVFAAEDGPPAGALESLRMPAFFLTGSEEPNSTPQMSRAMAALVPDGRAEVIALAAHMMPMTHADAVNRKLLDFASECQP
ncbi:alpha/beta hydrolase [Maritimibacter sp. 55A14]|uniref:alpha/beta fold hydrolase n=1 Tax=Maritimibacter sp. 55A14 TaxID=2174844 RepID=UPI000D612C43|nr:alpha/beta hydrolase [Maritimibacter sp. 55A14]PWE32611.1 alpha/beta hydrolase [Maritimibacter sp. 55A14]